MESALHILSGCQCHVIRNMVTERHKIASVLILQVVSEGSYGSNLIHMDVGSADCLAQHDMQITEHFSNHIIPPYLFDPSILDQARQIKCCEDTRPGVQLEVSRQQHSELCELQGAEITLHTILLGVGGIINAAQQKLDTELCNKITFDTNPTYPHADIKPTGSCEYWLREVDLVKYTDQQFPHPASLQTGSYSHSPLTPPPSFFQKSTRHTWLAFITRKANVSV
eukprot:1161328-Pelagomonas_calceolata.AAC.2